MKNNEKMKINEKFDSNRVKEYAKKKIEQIDLIQKDLEELKNIECFQKDELLNLATKINGILVLGTSVNLLQELKGFYENMLQKYGVEE